MRKGNWYLAVTSQETIEKEFYGTKETFERVLQEIRDQFVDEGKEFIGYVVEFDEGKDDEDERI